MGDGTDPIQARGVAGDSTRGAFRATSAWSGAEDHPVRAMLMRHLEIQPGSNLQRICSALGLNRGTATYHLHILERKGLLVSARRGRERVLFAKGDTHGEVGGAIGSRALEVAKRVAREPGTTSADLAAALGISMRSLRIHLQVLRTYDLIQVEPGHQGVRHFPTAALRILLDRQEELLRP